MKNPMILGSRRPDIGRRGRGTSRGCTSRPGGRWSMDFEEFDLIVVGAGFFGLTIAERAANVLGRKVCVLERRDHFGGDSYSETDPESDLEYQTSRSRLFHTNSEEIWEYLHQFTTFTSYRH